MGTAVCPEILGGVSESPPFTIYTSRITMINSSLSICPSVSIFIPTINTCKFFGDSEANFCWQTLKSGGRRAKERRSHELQWNRTLGTANRRGWEVVSLLKAKSDGGVSVAYCVSGHWLNPGGMELRCVRHSSSTNFLDLLGFRVLQDTSRISDSD